MPNTPDESEFGREWVGAYFREVDRQKSDSLMNWYTDDATFRFANADPAKGKQNIQNVLDGFYSQIKSMRHEMTGCWIDEASMSGVWEADVHFVTNSGVQAVLPAVSILRLKDGRVDDFRFVMDAAPLKLGG